MTVSVRLFLPGGCRGESVFSAFPASRSHLHSLAHGPFHLQGQQWPVEHFSHPTTPTLSLHFLP